MSGLGTVVLWTFAAIGVAVAVVVAAVWVLVIGMPEQPERPRCLSCLGPIEHGRGNRHETCVAFDEITASLKQ